MEGCQCQSSASITCPELDTYLGSQLQPFGSVPPEFVRPAPPNCCESWLHSETNAFNEDAHRVFRTA